MVTVAADPARMEEAVLALAEYGRVGESAVTRLAFTSTDEAAHAFVEQRMRAAGLQTRVDAFGNVFGRRAGTRAGALPILTGSHLDGPPDGGMFDGTIGVLCALEAIHLLDARGVRTEHPIEVVAIRCEHLDRFGVSCLGSRALSGKLTDADLDRLRDGLVEPSQPTLREALTAAGHLREGLDSVRLAGRVDAFVELHIEQGRVLEDRGERLGVVTGIAGPTRFRVRLVGSADHSGGTPMSLRRDALCGAAETILELERIARESSSSVGTVGVISARPGAVHTIPGDVELRVDIRGTDADEKRDVVARFRSRLEAIARERELELTVESSVDEDPVPCAPRVRAAIAEALADAGIAAIEMPSGGGHDAQHLAHCTEVGMLFVPSIGGISHTPDERTSWDDLAHGAQALALCLERLAVPCS